MRSWQRWPLLCGVFMWLAMPAAAETHSPRVGQRHPGFTLPAIDDGRPISLDSLRGKKVLLIQFASW